MTNQTTEDVLTRARAAIELDLDRAGRWPSGFTAIGETSARDAFRHLAGDLGLSLAWRELHTMGLCDATPDGPARLARIIEGAELVLARAERYNRAERVFVEELQRQVPEWECGWVCRQAMSELTQELQSIAGMVVVLHDAAIASPALVRTDPSLFESSRWAWHGSPSIDPNLCAWLEGVKAAALKAMAGASSPAAGAGEAQDAEELPAPLRPADQLVLRTMDTFDPRVLLSLRQIHLAMDTSVRIQERSIGSSLDRLIEYGLAERPEGERSGARLTISGRKLAKNLLG